MKKKMAILVAGAAFAALANPASAAVTSGGRLEVIAGWDHGSVDFTDFGIADDIDGDGIVFGIGAGYDFAVGTGTAIGIDVEASESTGDIDITDGATTAEISVGRDLYVGGRFTFAAGSNANVYVKAGYTNARIHATVPTASTSSATRPMPMACAAGSAPSSGSAAISISAENIAIRTTRPISPATRWWAPSAFASRRTAAAKRKCPGRTAGAFFLSSESEAYGFEPLIAVETLVKVVLRLAPSPCMAAMAATAIRAAIRPYSIAVAPFSSRIMRRSFVIVIPMRSSGADSPSISVLRVLGKTRGKRPTRAARSGY